MEWTPRANKIWSYDQGGSVGVLVLFAIILLVGTTAPDSTYLRKQTINTHSALRIRWNFENVSCAKTYNKITKYLSVYWIAKQFGHWSIATNTRECQIGENVSKIPVKMDWWFLIRKPTKAIRCLDANASIVCLLLINKYRSFVTRS